MNNKVVFDQYFLQDDEIVRKMIALLDLKKKDVVLEIGPGKGNITKHLVFKSGKIFAVEIDKNFKQDLEKIKGNVQIVFGDGLKFLDEKIKTKAKITKIISSLPSSLVEPVFYRLIDLNFETAVFLIPLIFVKKLEKSPLFKAFFQTNFIGKVEKASFSPCPRNNWALVKIIKISRLKEKDEYFLIKFLYFHRTAKLKNSLMEAVIKRAQRKGRVITKNSARNIVNGYKIENNKLDNYMNFNDYGFIEELNKVFKE